MVMSLAGGATPRHGYWVQPFENGSIGFLYVLVIYSIAFQKFGVICDFLPTKLSHPFYN
jgi:hypothetical protein